LRTSIARRIQVVLALITASVLLGSLVPIVAADGGLEVTTPYPAVAVAPGSKVIFDLTVSSTRVADITLELAGYRLVGPRA